MRSPGVAKHTTYRNADPPTLHMARADRNFERDWRHPRCGSCDSKTATGSSMHELKNLRDRDRRWCALRSRHSIPGKGGSIAN